MTTPAATLHPHPMRQILILALGPAIGIGFGRFAYALILPDMRDSLHWSYAMAGFMNTANAAGYFIGAIGAASFAKYFGLFKSVMIGATLCVLSLILCALSGNPFSFSFGRFISGVSAAIIFVSAASLASTIAQAHAPRSGLLIGVYNSFGLGLIVSGLIAPVLLQIYGPGSWWIVWSALASISVVIAAGLLLAPRDANIDETPDVATRISIAPMRFFLASYFMFGMGYIAYMTFMFAYVRDAGGSPVAQSSFWCLIGLGSAVSPWLWSGLMARGQSGRTMSILLTILLIATLFARFGQSPLWLGASAFLFGSTSIGVGTAILTFARFNYPPEAWPKAIATLTIIFSIGQTLGPFITGAITDAMGSLTYALNVSMVALAIGIVFAILQKPLARSAVMSDMPL